MGVRWIFSRVEVIFLGCGQKDFFPGRANNGEILFYQLRNYQQNIFYWNGTWKYQSNISYFIELL